MTRYLPRAVLAVFVAFMVIATVLTLRRDTTRVLGSNSVPQAAWAVTVPPGERACQAVPPAPPTTRAIRMTVGVYGDQRARLRADAGYATDGRAVTPHDGEMELPLSGADHAARVCISNLGRGKVELSGLAVAAGTGATVGDEPTDGVFGMHFLRGPEQTWAERAGDVLARVGYAKTPGAGTATGVVLIALLIATLGGAVALAGRALRP